MSINCYYGKEKEKPTKAAQPMQNVLWHSSPLKGKNNGGEKYYPTKIAARSPPAAWECTINVQNLLPRVMGIVTLAKLLGDS